MENKMPLTVAVQSAAVTVTVTVTYRSDYDQLSRLDKVNRRDLQWHLHRRRHSWHPRGPFPYHLRASTKRSTSARFYENELIGRTIRDKSSAAGRGFAAARPTLAKSKKNGGETDLHLAVFLRK